MTRLQICLQPIIQFLPCILSLNGGSRPKLALLFSHIGVSRIGSNSPMVSLNVLSLPRVETSLELGGVTLEVVRIMLGCHVSISDVLVRRSIFKVVTFNSVGESGRLLRRIAILC